MLRVGLTGGLASGKSFVGHALAELGCHLIEADELGHQVLLPGAEAYDAVVNEFGDEILDEDRYIVRRRLGALVWDHPERLAKLNSIVHPVVIARQQEIIAKIAEQDPAAIVVVEAAILVETGSYRRFDRLIVVVCTLEQQVERAMKRSAYSKEEVLARLSRQLPLEEKVRVADYVIDTSGTKEHTLEQVKTVYDSLRSLSV
ncbi:MAG TPA: dephospho-CoA kinase [Bryobacteraceae bacterium]|jgi:dephospho-CoA kinase|nr:dephospho-CoA kinase [Bryobacteraceae bacterium]